MEDHKGVRWTSLRCIPVKSKESVRMNVDGYRRFAIRLGDADTVSGIAADAEGDLTAEERREVEAVIKDIRRRRRQREGDPSPG